MVCNKYVITKKKKKRKEIKKVSSLTMVGNAGA